MRALMWFRADLRVEDNHALYHACTEADRGVIGVFVVAAQQWREHDWADAKVGFLLRNLACLAERLKALNIPLRVLSVPTFARAPEALLGLARDTHSDAVFFNCEYEVNEWRRDQRVAHELTAAGLRVHSFDDQTVVRPHALRTGQGGYYKVFTPFKSSWLDYVDEYGPGERFAPPRAQAEMPCASDPIPERVEGFDLDRGRLEPWPVGEREAARRLDRFIDERGRDYRKQRDLPAEDATSRLSPYLTIGVLSPRQCLFAALEANKSKLAGGYVGLDAWISELIWREFYRHVLVGFPRVSMNRPFREETDRVAWRCDEDDFAAWCAGQTGFPIIDAGMRQLAELSWMHNRLRMIVAMFLTKNLLIDWRWGERHFMRNLIDGDLASNNGGWQWSASTGTDAAPYFRIFNPASQAKKCDPAGDFIRRYVPELRDLPAATLHDATRLSAEQRTALEYPAPICDYRASRERALEAFKAVK